MTEIWKDINGYAGYQVSNFGRVRTHNKISSSARFQRRKWKDRILQYKGGNKPTCRRTGYRVDLWKDGKPHTMLVARITAFTFLGGDMNDHSLTVNHKDGNRLNNFIDNLELISLADNIRHGFRTGLYSTAKGVRIIDLQGAYIDFKSLSEASRYLGMSHGYVSNAIKKGKTLLRDKYGDVFLFELKGDING